MAGFAASTAPIVVLPRRRRFQRRHHRPDGRAGATADRHRLRQPLPAWRHDAGLSLAQGRPGANGGLHAAPFCRASDQGPDQRLSHVLAARDRADQDRVRPGFLLQHRTAGQSSPARLADRRGSGALVRTPARREPVSRAEMAAGLSALVPLCVRHDLLRRSPDTVALQSSRHKDWSHVRGMAED